MMRNRSGCWLLLVCLHVWAQGSDAALTSLNPEQARAFELEVLRQVADLALVPPRLNTAPLPNPNWHEHMVVERRDGSLWMLARTSTGVMQSTSLDRGKTWAAPSPPPGINHPVARFHVRKLASGRILLVKHGGTIDTHEGRSKLKAFLSEDDGLTWKGGLMLDERKGVSYPDGFQAPDGSLYVSYDRNRSTDGEILTARFREEDVLAGQLTHPDSKLQVLISRPLKKREAAPKR